MEIHGPFILEFKDGRRLAEVEVYVDPRAIAELLGPKAVRCARGISRALYGAILVKVREPGKPP